MATYPLRVARRRQETADALSLWFKVPSDLRTVFSYQAGQFITIEEDLGGETVCRQYSFSSAPECDEEPRITVKRLAMA